jgi:hypothetical protein
MSVEAKPESAVEVGLPIVLPPHLTENFEKAEAQLRQFYGVAPGVTALVRLWLACATASQIRREFELAVLDIKRRAIPPNAEGDFDDDYL